MTPFITRMIRAARLDASLYEEVEADRAALGQAIGVVVLSSLAAGIGMARQFGGFGHVVGGLFWNLVAWFVWALLVYFIGTRLLATPKTEADLGQLLRAIGFSAAPGLIRVLGVIPGLMAVVFGVAAVWMLIAMVVAVRQALDYDNTWRAVGVVAIGWVVQGVVLMLAIGVAAR
jgi:hypothetical protein